MLARRPLTLLVAPMLLLALGGGSASLPALAQASGGTADAPRP